MDRVIEIDRFTFSLYPASLFTYELNDFFAKLDAFNIPTRRVIKSFKASYLHYDFEFRQQLHIELYGSDPFSVPVLDELVITFYKPPHRFSGSIFLSFSNYKGVKDNHSLLFDFKLLPSFTLPVVSTSVYNASVESFFSFVFDSFYSDFLALSSSPP